MVSINTHVVIMAGGIGSRFWPMSTPDYPKQFIDVLGCRKSLIQLTVHRFEGLCPIGNIWIVTSKKYVDLVKEQLPSIPDENILTEPVRRNTAPCIAYAAWKIKSRYPDANMVVSPSDAFVADVDEYRKVLKQALHFTENSNTIVIIGIKPDRPDTGYGYIAAHSGYSEEIQKVFQFKEKPDMSTAQAYLDAGNYFWNAGIFVWNVQTIEAAIRKFTPQIADVFDGISHSFYTDNEKNAIDAMFPECDNVSIDYAVMEKASNIYVLPANFGWSDLGSWGALQSLHKNDKKKNALHGDNILLYDCEDCMIHTEGLNEVKIQGLIGYVVAIKEGRLLICKKEKVKEII